MSRRTFDENRDHTAPPDEPQVTRACPAFGCPNAASVSLNHGATYACYDHARASSEQWPAVTHEIRANMPASLSWDHPEKLAYERKKAAERRAKLPQHAPGSGGMFDALANATRSYLP
jgi:hypothetical protein